jgi:hypothetical protein
VVGWERRCIVTDKVLRENPNFGKDELLKVFRERLHVDDVIVIPKEPYDVVGHADGVVRFLDEGTVAINEPGPEDVIIVLGDFIVCGPDSQGVIERLIGLFQRCRFDTILGNRGERLPAALETGSVLRVRAPRLFGLTDRRLAVYR